MLRGGSNFVFTWSKAIKTILYEVNHLTLLWPPLGPWGLPLLWVSYSCISKMYRLVKSVNAALMLPASSNFVLVWSKAMKTIFYKVNHLTLLWPPFDPWEFAPALSLIFMYWQKVPSCEVCKSRSDASNKFKFCINMVKGHENNILWVHLPDPTMTPICLMGVCPYFKSHIHVLPKCIFLRSLEKPFWCFQEVQIL